MPSEVNPPFKHSGSGKIGSGEGVGTPSQVYGPSGHSESVPVKQGREFPKTPAPGLLSRTEPKVAESTSDKRETKPEVPRVAPDLLLDLIRLFGGKKSALLIPANSSEPVTKTEFNQDKLWQYDIAIYDRDKVFLKKKHAESDQLIPRPNSLATDYVKNHSDAAKEPDSRLDTPEDLYGDVYVLSYDRVLEIITGLEGQLDQLKRSLEWIAPFRKFD